MRQNATLSGETTVAEPQGGAADPPGTTLAVPVPAVCPEASPPALAQNQLEALRFLVVGRSITEAARAAGVHRATVHRWLCDNSDFAAIYRESRQSLQEDARSVIQSYADQALANLRWLLDPYRSEGTKLRATLAVLKMIGADRPAAPPAAADEPAPRGAAARPASA